MWMMCERPNDPKWSDDWEFRQAAIAHDWTGAHLCLISSSSGRSELWRCERDRTVLRFHAWPSIPSCIARSVRKIWRSRVCLMRSFGRSEWTLNRRDQTKSYQALTVVNFRSCLASLPRRESTFPVRRSGFCETVNATHCSWQCKSACLTQETNAEKSAACCLQGENIPNMGFIHSKMLQAFSS
jgi:hypothetical protein